MRCARKWGKIPEDEEFTGFRIVRSADGGLRVVFVRAEAGDDAKAANVPQGHLLQRDPLSCEGVDETALAGRVAALKLIGRDASVSEAALAALRLLKLEKW